MTNKAALDNPFAAMWPRGTGELEDEHPFDPIKPIIKNSSFPEDIKWELFNNHSSSQWWRTYSGVGHRLYGRGARGL